MKEVLAVAVAARQLVEERDVGQVSAARVTATPAGSVDSPSRARGRDRFDEYSHEESDAMQAHFVIQCRPFQTNVWCGGIGSSGGECLPTGFFRSIGGAAFAELEPNE